MEKLTGVEMKKVLPLFDLYINNQAVIYSVLENQFDGCVYTDGRYAILSTPFLQHFIAGVPDGACEAEIENILFDTILCEQAEKEIAVFAVSEQWHGLLDKIFAKRNGVSDGRKIFSFRRDVYEKIKRTSIPKNINTVVELRKYLPFSRKDTWSARLFADGEEASSSSAIMVGKGMAEIEISTGEKFRGKGYATLTATLLIDKLLEHNLTPTWSTWPYRTESQHIAQKLGFTPRPDAKAWIWTKDMQANFETGFYTK